MDLFAVGTDQKIYSIWWDANGGWDASSGWGTWFQIAGGVVAPNTSINASSRYSDILDVFVVGTDDHVDTIWWLDEIYFSMQHQQQSNWCWAATATSVALFYQPASGWTQCQVASSAGPTAVVRGRRAPTTSMAISTRH